MTREYFICSCENTEHQIVFSWFEDDDVANVYATIHLRKKSFWARLKYGIKYIFGYQCRYGAFDEFIFNPNDARKLERITRWLRIKGEENEDHFIDANKKVDRVIGTAEHIKTALDVLNKKGGENEKS